MVEVYYLAEYRHPQSGVSFQREEMNRLLALYSRRVARGEWKDYAIDHGLGMAVFSVFRHADDRPLFAIAKIAESRSGKGGYVLFSGSRILRKGASLADVLSPLEDRLKLVVSKA